MRTRLLVGTILLTTTTIAAFFVPAAWALAAAERDAQVVELFREATAAAAQLGRQREGHDADDRATAGGGEGADRDVGAEPGDEQHQYGLYDPTGRLVVGEGPARADEPVAIALDGRSATERIGDDRVVAIPTDEGGAVRATEPAAEADRRTRDAVLRLAAVASGVVLAASSAAWFLARRLSRPLAGLRAMATRLGGGDFTAAAARSNLPEIDEVAVALNASGARIGAMVERERRLTADTSHQLRTPLAGLRLALEGELAAPRADPTTVLEEALGAVHRMEATVLALTDLAREDSPAAALSLDDVALGAADRWRPLLAAAGRALEVDALSGATVAGRPAAFDTVADVLVDNALHHGRGTVRIATEATGRVARLLVADDGTCDRSDEQLFARRASGAGRSGIGLHLARSLADAEGARLRLASADPTTFHLVAGARPRGGGAGVAEVGEVVDHLEAGEVSGS